MGSTMSIFEQRCERSPVVMRPMPAPQSTANFSFLLGGGCEDDVVVLLLLVVVAVCVDIVLLLLLLRRELDLCFNL